MALYLKKVGKKDFVSGLSFFLLGLFLSFGWKRPSIWSASGPEEGFFPLAAGIILMGCSLLIIAKALVIARRHEDGGKLKKEKNEVNVFKVSSYIVLMSLSYALLESVGFLITSAFFLTAILKYVEKQTWKITFLVGIGSTIVSYVVFAYFLGVPLPKGLIKW